MDLLNLCISTKRLILIPVRAKYRREIYRETVPEVTEYLSFYSPKSISETDLFIRDSRIKMRKGTDLAFALITKKGREFIGCAGIHKIQTSKPELGIWIKRKTQKKGYGNEAVKGLIKWIERNIKYEFIAYPVAVENSPSKRLAESLGAVSFKKQKSIFKSGKILNEVEYRIYPGRIKEKKNQADLKRCD